MRGPAPAALSVNRSVAFNEPRDPAGVPVTVQTARHPERLPVEVKIIQAR